MRKGSCVSEETRAKMRLAKKGKKHPMWTGGIRKGATGGYVRIYKPNHPLCSKDGYVREHRLVMENHIGRYLKKGEQVHHINEVTHDNRLENLKLFNSIGEHSEYHNQQRRSI